MASRRPTTGVARGAGRPRFVLRLAKEDFKFSVAHFTVFSEAVAEDLHGHNYRVRVEIVGDALDRLGLLLDLRGVKSEIRRLCAELDSRTLVPERCDLVRVVAVDGDGLEVRFGPRVYRLPRAEVRLLPIRNTSIEELALWFWRQLEPTLAGGVVSELRVEVEETAGQSCVYSARLGRAP
jgi:6-pyruvoyltetrahydropterin/6-carboxytetrahydropterin synthase